MSTILLSSLPPMPTHSGSATPNSPEVRPKRRLSNAAHLLHRPSLESYSDNEDDAADQQPRSKRQRATGGAAVGSLDGSGTAGVPSTAGTAPPGSPSSAPPKVLSEKEKDARRQARMIRNRNAAQASRDRKKEHTMFLERRVAELEAQLRGGGIHPLAASTFTASSPATPAAAPSNSKPSRSQRSTSVASSSGGSGSSSSNRIADLEDENESLRTQLHLEQAETGRLRSRLDSLEDKFAKFSALMAADTRTTPATTTTPFPTFEPTFAFDTTDLKTLPQPEELAFVEARNRQRLQTQPHGGPTDTPMEPLMMTNSFRLVAAESVPLSSSTSASASVGSVSPALSASVSSTPSSIASLDLASTPPATESYLDELDSLTAPPLWTEWVKTDDADKEDDSASGLAFVDFDFVNDGPVIAAC